MNYSANVIYKGVIVGQLSTNRKLIFDNIVYVKKSNEKQLNKVVK